MPLLKTNSFHFIQGKLRALTVAYNVATSYLSYLISWYSPHSPPFSFPFGYTDILAAPKVRALAPSVFAAWNILSPHSFLHGYLPHLFRVSD